MKVLFFSADSNGGYPIPAVLGGAVSALVEKLVSENNDKQNLDFAIVSFYDPEAKKIAELKYPNVRFIWVKIPKAIRVLDKIVFDYIKKYRKSLKAVSFKSTFSLLLYIVKARRLVRRENSDCIVLENNIPLALILKGNRFHARVCYHLHNVPRINAKCRDVFKRVDDYICVSGFVADEVAKKTNPIGPVPNEKMRILYNCVDTNEFRPIERDSQTLRIYRNRYSIKDDDFVIVFIGRLTAEKGVDLLLKAAKYVHSERIHILIVGSFHYNDAEKTSYQEYLQELSKDIRGKVTFTGYVRNDELQYIYNLADLAVLPSMWDEPAGLTNIEAMSCGIPVITTNSGGIKEYVGDSAIVVERGKNTAEDIARSIKLLMDNDALREKYSLKARERVLNNFDKKKYYQNFCKIIEESED